MSNLFGLRVYPRGFLGAQRPPVILKKPGAGRSQSLQYDTSIFDANTSQVVVADTAIENLYRTFVRQDTPTNTFDFREKILTTVLRSFGMMDFEAWYRAQFSSPSFGHDHLNFLDDTLRFITTGQRQMALNMWDTILETVDEPLKDHEDLSTIARQFFQQEYVSNLGPRGRCLLVDIVQDWVSKPGGMSDLLITAHILFGLKQ